MGWMEKLRQQVSGRMIAPDDPDYEKARKVFLASIDIRPAAILKAADPGDVARAVTAADESGVELAVRSGGHSPAGHGLTEGGLVVDLSDMRAMEIDARERTAWAQTGLTAGEYSVRAGEHGLATGFGDTGSVGIGGITLSGGIGYLVRAHGLTIDSLLAAEMVMADGSVIHTDENDHPDLFWAIRGGGGNFGVATKFRYRLHPVEEFVGGMLFLPASPEVVAGFMEAAGAAPDGLSTIANVMPAPPMPFLPEEHHGKLVVMALMAYLGGPESADTALAPFRSLAEPIADLLKPMPYPEIYPPDDEEYRPLAVSQNLFMDAVGLDVAGYIMEALEASDAAMRAVQLRTLGGAMARVPDDATAFAYRGSPIMANVASFYEGPDDRPLRERWVTEVSDRLRGANRAAYVGFLGDEGPDRVQDAYPGATLDRLATIKARYDPDNIFHRNQNVPPARA